MKTQAQGWSLKDKTRMIFMCIFLFFFFQSHPIFFPLSISSKTVWVTKDQLYGLTVGDMLCSGSKSMSRKDTKLLQVGNG